MTGYVIAHVDEIEEANDGRCPWRPVRHHFGITAFGVSTWTGRDAGDRILNEDDELSREPGHLRAEEIEEDANEQLYLVHRGRARFELADEQVDAPAGTFVFVPPGVGGRPSPRSRERRSSRSVASPGRLTSRPAGRSGRPSTRSTSRAGTTRSSTAGAS